MLRKFAVGFVLLLTVAVNAAAQNTVFVVRHAERADAGSSAAGMMATDPDLSDMGHTRAHTLAFMLKSANIGTIIATEFKRTQQTAAPLAQALGIEITIVGSREKAKVPALVKAATGNVLIVGHSNTVPEILASLGIAPPVTLDEAEYDNLFIVTMGAQPAMVRLHFR